jgi:tetratricopeptide (TPR) repeat protein
MISIDSEVDQTDTSPDYANRIQALTEQIQQSSGDKAAALYEALGQVQLKVGAVDGAVDTYSTCLKRFGDNARLQLNLGHAYKAKGELALAIGAYQAVAQDPIQKAAVTGLWSLANLKGYGFSNQEVQKLETLSESKDLSLGHQSLAQFALGDHWAQTSAYQRAFTAFEIANQGIAQIRPFPGDQYQNLIKTLIDFVHRVSWTPSEAMAEPIFIVGMPRSGSTLVEQILSAHSQVEATDELMLMGDFARKLEQDGGYATRIRRLQDPAVEDLAERYLRLSAVFRPMNLPIFIDKNPNNFLHIGLIKRLFPKAKIVNVVRDPLDNAISVFKQFFAQGHEYSYSVPGIVFYWQGYLTLMKHWQALFPGQIYHLDYEALVTSPVAEIENLLRYCALTPEPLCFTPHLSERAVMTPSAAQVRNPISTASLGSGLHYKSELLATLPQIAALKHQAKVWLFDDPNQGS